MSDYTEKTNECDCLNGLRAYLNEHQMSVYSEHEENGWVNVNCQHMTYETELDRDTNREVLEAQNT